MFSLFFTGLQQDFKIFLLAPLVLAIFRLAFILTYAPNKNPRSELKKWLTTFNYGFWWGMDFNAYVFLYSLILVSLPAAFFSSYFAIGDTVRVVGVTIYLAILYLAFMGKMIFYYHFHDTFNQTIRLGRNADKKNFIDIFFNQNHGALILIGFPVYLALCAMAAKFLLALPTVSYIELSSPIAQYALNTAVFLLSILLFYFFRYGGTLNHRKKPEWDEVPVIVKDDIFFSKATIDDLIALELVYKKPLNTALTHSDEESIAIFKDALPESPAIISAIQAKENPLLSLRRTARGAKIKKPAHIFLIVGESHGQAPFDSFYKDLKLMEYSEKWRSEEHTVAINNFLPGGMISQPSLVSLAAGIFDCDLELNENKTFWFNNVPTSLPLQLKKLGYKSRFFYGGGLNWSSLEHFMPAIGFDESYGGSKLCPPNSPATWLGVYDHIFLNSLAEFIEKNNSEPTFNLIYTTSNHGPYNMPYEKMGFDIEKLMPNAPRELKNDTMTRRRFGGMWYADKAIIDFVYAMRKLYPDSLFIVTGDHTTGLMPYNFGLVDRNEPTLRESVLTSFAVSHPELTPAMLKSEIGSHASILATIMELIAPADTPYLSIAPPLTENIDHVVTPYCYLTSDIVGDYRSELTQPLAPSSTMPPYGRELDFTRERAALLELTSYMLRHSELLNDAGIGKIV